MTKHLTILIAILLAALGLKAQTKVYPIQVTISGSSDISAELSELYGVKSTLMFTFQCLDRSETSLPVAVKVRLYPSTGHGKAIENKLQTGKKTFDIGFGQTIIEQKGELEKYFLNEYTNLSQAGYYQNGQLAEGNYILQVTCYDARTITRQISNTAKMYLHIDQFNYPTLLFPRNNTDLEQYTTKPTISFQWTYYGKTDPKIRYRFELWEVINPTTVETYVKQNNPIFVDDDIFVTQKSYMPELLQLKIGQKYCWRVTAYDDDHKLPFKRGGESDVYQFQYLNPPVPVTGLANKVTGKQIKYTWNADRNHTKYYVEYYDYKRDTTISSSQQDNTVTLTAPEYDYRIKFRVRAECYNDPARVSEYTPWSEAYVQPEKKIDFECGKQFPDREITNQELKTTFFEGEIVESKNGDSRYEIIKATANPDGSLDGKFYAIMDCWSGAKILCDFWDTKINTDNIILTTRYRSEDIPGFVADPEEIKKYVHELVNNAHMAATDNKIRDTILINQKFDYLYAENGRLKAVVVDNNGEPQVTDVTPDKPYSQSLITDGQGDTLVVSKKGQVMGVKEYKFAGDDRHLLNEYHRQLDSLGDWQINFNSAKEKQTYAFDQIGSGNHGIFATDEYYPTSGNYDFRYKSVECGKNDKVIVDFGSYPEKDSVIFKDKYGVKLKVVDGNILSFTGVSQPDTNYIYAYRGDKKIGKLFLNTYQQKTYKVVLISVNEATLPNTTDLENYLNKVYNQCAVSFKIETRKLQVTGIENFTHGGTKVAGSVWNASQKAVLEAFGEKYEDNTAYLFFIPKAETGGVAGYMPRYYPYGFIYPGAANRTIAHELGHGIAGLEHPFPESQVSGNTANLMDYRDGEELWHFQWDMLQDPARKIFKWWQNEEGAEAFDLGANIVCITDEEIQKIKATQRYFFIADGRVVDLKDYNPSGFYTKDDKTESARGAVAKIRIDGYDYGMYYNKDTKQVSFFGYNIDNDHAAKKVEVAKLIVDDPEKLKLAQRVFPSDNTCDCKNFDINNHPNLQKLLVQKIENQKQAWLYDEKENKIIVVFGTDDAQSLLKVKNGTALSLDEIEGAEIKNYTLKEFANSKYNWLANDVRSTMNEAGKYVAISMGVAIAIEVLGEKAGRDFLVGSLQGFIDKYLIWQFKDGNNHKTPIDFLKNECAGEYASEFWEDIIKSGLSNVFEDKVMDITFDCLTTIDWQKSFKSDEELHKIILKSVGYCVIGIIFNRAGEKLKNKDFSDYPGLEKGIDRFNQFWQDGFKDIFKIYIPLNSSNDQEDTSEGNIWIPPFLLRWRKHFYDGHKNAQKIELLSLISALLLCIVFFIGLHSFYYESVILFCFASSLVFVILLLLFAIVYKITHSEILCLIIVLLLLFPLQNWSFSRRERLNRKAIEANYYLVAGHITNYNYLNKLETKPSLGIELYHTLPNHKKRIGKEIKTITPEKYINTDVLMKHSLDDDFCYILCYNIPPDTLAKYRYPVVFKNGKEIGNNHFCYAKASPETTYRNFGLNIVYKAKLAASPQNDSIAFLLFEDIMGIQQTIQYKLRDVGYIPSIFLIFKNINDSISTHYTVCTPEINTPTNWAKIDGYGYLFGYDEVYSKQEIESQCPRIREYVEQYKKQMSDNNTNTTESTAQNPD